MRVCVVGGAGFLGSHVADELTRQGHEVLIYDKELSRWLQPGQAHLQGDLSSITDLRYATKDCKFVFNFAALADINDALENPIETINVNILGNANLLEACRHNSVMRYIYASSVYVYSNEGGFYRCSKQAAESYIEEYSKYYGQDFTILRYGSLYGPRSNRANGIYRIIENAIKSKKISYQGSKESIREYIHVYDAAASSVLSMDDRFRNETLTLTGDQPMRVLDMLEMLAEILSIKTPIEFVDGPQPGHYIRTPYHYSNKIGKKFNPQLHVDIGQGLLQLIDEITHAESPVLRRN